MVSFTMVVERQHNTNYIESVKNGELWDLYVCFHASLHVTCGQNIHLQI